MRTIIIVLVLSSYALVLPGCAGKHCIELGGTWGKEVPLSGNLKYCIDLDSTEEAGRPILIPDDATNQKVIGLLESDIVSINTKLHSAYMNTAPDENPIKKLLKIIGK